MAVRFDDAERLGVWARAHGVARLRLGRGGELIEAVFASSSPSLSNSATPLEEPPPPAELATITLSELEEESEQKDQSAPSAYEVALKRLAAGDGRRA